jgi:putative transposase
MRFKFVEEQRGAFPIDRLCQVMNVSPRRGLRAFRSRPASRRQRTDMVVLAHIHCPAGHHVVMSREGRNNRT